MQYSALVGDLAYEFSLPDTEGAVRRLAEFRQLGPAALLFVPTAGGWASRCQFWNFLRHYDAFVGFATEVVVIAGDPPPQLRRLQARLGLPFVFLADPPGRVAERYGTGAGAATLLVDTHGIIRFRHSETWFCRTPAHRLLAIAHHLTTPMAVQ
ncbi:MAG: peroxiredoxin family protein [Terriglobales bacterium]